MEVGSNPRLPLDPDTEQKCSEQTPGRSESRAGGSKGGPKRVKFLFSSRPLLKLFLVKSKCFQVTPGRKMPGITMWVYSAGRGACNAVRLHCTQWKKDRVILPNLMSPCRKSCPGCQQGGCWHRARAGGALYEGQWRHQAAQPLREASKSALSASSAQRQPSPGPFRAQSAGELGRRGGECSEWT